MTESHAQLIAQHREQLIHLLKTPERDPHAERCKLSDDDIKALCDRAYDDPPFKDDGESSSCVVMRDSVLLRLPGMPVVAVSPEEWQHVVEAAEFNRAKRQAESDAQQEQQSKEKSRESLNRKGKSKRPSMSKESETTASQNSLFGDRQDSDTITQHGEKVRQSDRR